MSIILFDRDGEVTDDPALARTAEITEEDDLGRVTRASGTINPPAGGESGNGDGLDDDTADFTKAGAWDVWIQRDGEYALVETLDELGSVLDFAVLPEGAQREQLANLMLLPVWESMPEPLREEIRTFLERTRPV